MTTDRVLRTLAVLALTLPLTALADQARTRSWVSVRAGPGGNYPLVMKLAPGSFVQVNGCTHRYRWCDVIASDGQRGWAQGGSLYYPYQNGEVPVMGYGPSIGVPIVTFAMSDYWGLVLPRLPLVRAPPILGAELRLLRPSLWSGLRPGLRAWPGLCAATGVCAGAGVCARPWPRAQATAPWPGRRVARPAGVAGRARPATPAAVAAPARPSGPALTPED